MQIKKLLLITALVFSMNNIANAENNLDAIEPLTNSSSATQLEEIKEQLRSIRGELEKVQFENMKLKEQMTKLSADIELRFQDLSKSNAQPETSVFSNLEQSGNLHPTTEQKTDAKRHDLLADDKHASNAKKDAALEKEIKPSAKEQPKEAVKESVTQPAKADKKTKDKMVHDQYQDAYALLKNQDYKKAQSSFQQFITEHPKSELIGSAYYWLGETYYVQNEFNSAAVNYLKGYQNGSHGSRAADNLLKLAKSLAKLEKSKEACTSLQKLKKEFPSANENIKKQVAEETTRLKCNE